VLDHGRSSDAHLPRLQPKGRGATAIAAFSARCSRCPRMGLGRPRREFTLCGVLRTRAKTGGGFVRTSGQAPPALARVYRRRVRGLLLRHMPHRSTAAGHGWYAIVRAGRGGERRQQVCQADVPTTQGAQTSEAFQEALTRAQRCQPTRRAQAIPCWHMTSLDRLGRLPQSHDAARSECARLLERSGGSP